MPQWKELYSMAITETRPIELRMLIDETERAITLRLREVGGDPFALPERHEIDNARSALKVLSREVGTWGQSEAY
jgi:hypothetical protein